MNEKHESPVAVEEPVDADVLEQTAIAEPTEAAPNVDAASPVQASPRHPRLLAIWRAIGFAGPSLLLVLAGILVIALLGVAQRYGWISSSGESGVETVANDSGTIYACPMHPQIRQNRPGSCSICGMPLESIQGATTGGTTIEVDSVARRLANITTAPATRVSLTRIVTAPGAITYDETRVRRIIVFVDGRLERLIPDYTGFDVRKGDEIMVVYSPDLYVAQREFLDNKRAVEKGASKRYADFDRELLEASRHKLIEQFGMTEAQVKRLEDTRKAETRETIHATIGGTVIEKLADEGQDLKAGQTVLKIADLSVVWLQLELYPEDAAQIRYGQKVTAELKSLPGRSFEGRVAFVDREVETKTRTVGVRVVIENEDGALRPGDYATATIEVPMLEQKESYDGELAGKWISPRHPQVILDEPGKCPICAVDLVQTSKYGYADEPISESATLTIPRSALLSVGRTSLVYVETDPENRPGVYEPRRIVTGSIVNDRVVVLEGLRAGEMVVDDGTFLLDSKSQLAGSPSLMDPTRAKDRPDIVAPEVDGLVPEVLAGTAGELLEKFYGAYLDVQSTLAADKTANEAQAAALHQSATALLKNDDVPAELNQYLRPIAKVAEHLHHGDLASERESFESISYNAINIAARARGENAAPLYHNFCSMVDGGGGHWLDSKKPKTNPYKGSQMLHCGDQEHEFHIAASPSTETTP